jgi:RNA polymerase sigma-70 factor (ECF subfamily)
MTRDRDAMLVEACLSGDPAAFGALVDSYEGKLYNVALQITRSRDDAMDVTQSAFVKAYEKLHTFDPSYRFFSWIYRIAINEALNHARRKGPVTGLDLDSLLGPDDPEQASSDHETRRLLYQAVGELSPEHRTVVVLKHLEGLSYRETAEVLGISEKKVKSRLFTARQKLRALLEERGVTR